jgi:hypothetical protein
MVGNVGAAFDVRVHESPARPNNDGAGYSVRWPIRLNTAQMDKCPSARTGYSGLAYARRGCGAPRTGFGRTDNEKNW